MTDFLMRLFVKDTDMENESTRLKCGTLSSVVGICCNLFLFMLKFLIGTFMCAAAIVGDAFNNLSDCLTCIVALFGYRIAAKPADREHPFGHGRMEYLISLLTSVLILAVGLQLFMEGLGKVLHPTSIVFSLPMFVILAASILVKLWMAVFYRKIGTVSHNMIVLAASKDSISDVFTTSAALVSLVAALFFPSLPVDGVAGMLVSLLVVKAGYELAKDIVDRLLGKPADAKLYKDIKSVILSFPEAIGVHDVIVHDYGPGRLYGTAHVELDSRLSFVRAHEITDEAERRLHEALHVTMTLHMDPVEMDDSEAMHYRQLVEEMLRAMDENISMHDFQHVHKGKKTVLYFDVLLPYKAKQTPEEIERLIQAMLAGHDRDLEVNITFDHDYMEEKNGEKR